MKVILVFLSLVILNISFSQNEEIKYFDLDDTIFEVGSIYQIDSIEYDFDGSGLRPHSREVLISIFDFLVKNRNLVIQISTHTDERGNDQYNLKLSQRRSMQVVDFLHHQGIPYERLVPHGYGETTPYTTRKRDTLFEIGSVLNEDFIYSLNARDLQEEAHQLNRRTEMKILAIDFVDTTDYGTEDRTETIEEEPPLNTPIEIPGIQFDFDQDHILPKCYETLDGFAQFLKDHPTYQVEIACHSDCRGNWEFYSRRLTQDRAESVVAYLEEKGIERGRMIPKGYEGIQPKVHDGVELTCEYIDSKETAQEKEMLHQMNRRIEFTIVSKNYYPSAKKIDYDILKKGGVNIIAHPKKEFGKDYSEERDSIIQSIYDLLVAHPKMDIIIEVHTDCRGTEEGNLKISEEIGARIKSELQEMGITPDRIRIVPKGESEPYSVNLISYNCSFIEGVHSDQRQEELHAKNRRLVIKINPIEYDF